MIFTKTISIKYFIIANYINFNKVMHALTDITINSEKKKDHTALFETFHQQIVRQSWVLP